MAQYATSFSEFVDLIATNDPYGTILSWWRRIDRALNDYYSAKGRSRPKRVGDIESDLAADPKIGEEGVKFFRALRLQRNRVAHEDVGLLSRSEAVAYAQQAHRLGWAIGAALSLSELKILLVDETPSNSAFNPDAQKPRAG